MSDLISRQDAIDAFMNVLGLKSPNWFPNQTEREVYEALKAIPSAEKTGRWTDRKGDKTETFFSVYCSECKGWSGYSSNFCPNCGAKMEVEHD